uniref:transposase domain-containing protein n=1 Tax=Pantoea ananas TaxID=553 RepID=UPI003D0B61E1
PCDFSSAARAACSRADSSRTGPSGGRFLSMSVNSCCTRLNGWAEIDNNIAENALRGVALGWKNWLFAGSDSGGERAAVLYSLNGTCRLNGIDPDVWLRYVLRHIQDWPVNRIRELLPWRFITENLNDL